MDAQLSFSKKQGMRPDASPVSVMKSDEDTRGSSPIANYTPGPASSNRH